MNNENQNPEEDIIDNPEDPKTPKDSIAESIAFVVDMMNQGKANPKDVYPPNRYHGD